MIGKIELDQDMRRPCGPAGLEVLDKFADYCKIEQVRVQFHVDGTAIKISA